MGTGTEAAFGARTIRSRGTPRWRVISEAENSETVTTNLKPGSYELACHLPGHYAAGQHIPFKVT